MSRRSATTTKVFVGSLPADATTDDLKRLFTPYGAIAECDIANRCGFLHLEDKDLAAKAIEDLNNSTFMGVRISVEMGRVKPPNKGRGGRGGGVGPIRGSRDRGGPYSRDGVGRSRGGGFAGREFAPYGDRYDYDRTAMARYDAGYGMERRPGYDDRRGGYMGERGRPYNNGFERRPSFDDRAAYPDAQRNVYDDRRLPSAIPTTYDDRRPPLASDRRPVMAAQDGQTSRPPPPSGYDRSSSNDMFTRRDAGTKSVDRQPLAANYSPSSTTYTANIPVYPSSSTPPTATYGGGYGDSRSSPSMGYENRTPVQTGGYGDSRAPASAAAYSESRGPPPLTSSMYAETRSGSAGLGYSNSPSSVGYNTASGAAYDSYGGARSGSYDAAYPPLPQQRGFASGGGPGPRRELPPGPGRRY